MGEVLKSLPRMTLTEFEGWYEAQTDGAKYELFDGIVERAQSELPRNSRIKAEVTRQFGNTIAEGSMPCDVYCDRVRVPISESSSFEPDVLVRCGPPLNDEAKKVTDALIVVEVESLSSIRRDRWDKLGGYHLVPTIAFYVIVSPLEDRVVVHERDGEGWMTRVHATGSVSLDPPGLSIDVDALFARRS